MTATLAVLAALLVLAVLGWNHRRHHHRWTAWGRPVDQPSGWPTQLRRCKAESCNRYQIKEIRP